MKHNEAVLMLIAACTACVVASRSASADSVTLRPTVQLDAGARTLMLKDVADLDGPEAQRFADLVVWQGDAGDSSAASAAELAVDSVRSLLAKAGAHWGKLNLNGRAVTIAPGPAIHAQAPLAMTGATLEESALPRGDDPPDDTVAADVMQSPTLRGMIAGLIATNLRVDPADVRLSFSRRDAELLDTPMSAARFEIQPLSNVTSDRITLAVRAWTNGQPGDRRTVNVMPLLKVRSPILRRDVQKDQRLTEQDIELAAQWLPPSQAAQASPRVQAAGRLAARGMKAGDGLSERHLRRELVMKRGEQAVVRCLVGGVAISLTAEARADGDIGDLIEFRKLGERDTFRATITARGEAVVDLTRREPRSQPAPLEQG